MESTAEMTWRQALSYSAKVSASISHELKNVLAILNENAGLLQDLVAIAEQGQPLDPERISHLSVTMQNQVKRGDAILKRMNRFAHSADKDRVVIELNETVRLVVELFERTASTRGVRVVIKSAPSQINIETSPIILETLIGELLYRVTEIVTGEVAVEVSEHEGGAFLRLAGLVDSAAPIAALVSTTELIFLAEMLSASIGFDPDEGALSISLSGVTHS